MDVFFLYIDGEIGAQLIDTQEFTDVALGIGAGAHTINFSYHYNPFNIPQFPPAPPGWLGATWIDSVSIETLAVAPPSRRALTMPGSSVRLPLNDSALLYFYSFSKSC